MTNSELWRWQHSATQPAEFAAEAVAFSSLTGWERDDHAEALSCYLRSADLAGGLPKPAPQGLGELTENAVETRRFFENNFTPFRILTEPGLLTSYFQPVLKGSRRPSREFPVAVYRRPPELEPLPTGHALADAGLTAARRCNGDFEPYHTRADIEGGALAGRGLEILYLACPIEAFIMHVQGSGRVELDDGSTAHLTFDGKNGHPYTSVARHLVEHGHLAWKDADLAGMTAWLRARADAARFLHENKSYIFFTERAGSPEGPKGSLGATLWAGRSLAADPLYHKPGSLIWISAPSLIFDGKPFQRLTVVQDTGSAIKGAQRGDIFAGTGSEAAEVAGKIRHKCQFIVFRPQ